MRVVPDLTGILGLLSEREQQVIRMRLGIGQRRRTFAIIGRHFSFNRSRAWYVYWNGINKLYDPDFIGRQRREWDAQRIRDEFKDWA